MDHLTVLFKIDMLQTFEMFFKFWFTAHLWKLVNTNSWVFQSDDSDFQSLYISALGTLKVLENFNFSCKNLNEPSLTPHLPQQAAALVT